MIYAVPSRGGGQKSKHILPVHQLTPDLLPLTETRVKIGTREKVTEISSRKRRIWTWAFFATFRQWRRLLVVSGLSHHERAQKETGKYDS